MQWWKVLPKNSWLQKGLQCLSPDNKQLGAGKMLLQFAKSILARGERFLQWDLEHFVAELSTSMICKWFVLNIIIYFSRNVGVHSSLKGYMRPRRIQFRRHPSVRRLLGPCVCNRVCYPRPCERWAPSSTLSRGGSTGVQCWWTSPWAEYRLLVRPTYPAGSCLTSQPVAFVDGTLVLGGIRDAWWPGWPVTRLI